MPRIPEDIRFAIRSFAKRPAFALVAIGSLALGIAVNATVFSWMRGIVLSPLSGVASGRQMVAVKTLASDGSLLDSSYPDFKDFRDQSKTLSGVIAFKQRPLYMGNPPDIERVWSQMVSGNFFDVLGVKPIVGRTFSTRQVESGVPVADAVIGEKFWRTRFQAASDIVGRTVKLNQQTFSVIGVVPADFLGTEPGLSFDIWVPITMQSQLTGSWNWLEDRDARPLMLMGRLAPGHNLSEAQAEITAIAKRLALTYPENRRLSAAVLPLSDSPDGVQRILGNLVRVLLVIAIAVLLIVCANVGNLLLTRTVSRQREFGIRLSLGATRSRLVRQLFTEVFVLACAGGIAGLIAASWLTRAIQLFAPPTDLPIATSALGLHPGDFLATLGLCVLTAILCVLAPTLQLFRRDVQDSLKEASRYSSASARSRTLHGILVLCELSLAVVAIVGTGLFIRSFHNAKVANPGFDPEHVLLAGLDLSQSRISASDSLVLLSRLQRELKLLPGVQNVSLCEDVPLGFAAGSWETIAVTGYASQPGESMKVWRNLISPEYFATLKIPILAGRDFNERDNSSAKPVAIVNQSFVRRYLHGQFALGREFHVWGKEATIIGVAQDSKYHLLSESPAPYFYLPISQVFTPDRGLGIEVRTEERPELFARTLRNAVQAIDPNLRISVTIPFVSYMSASYFAQKAGANLLSVLGIIALLLAALGLYGVMSYATNQRVREIGIRMALGARPGQVLAQVLREGAALCIAGIAIGLVLTLYLTRLAAGVLYGVGSTDLLTYCVAVFVLFVSGVAATWLPARRAARVNPVEALHCE